MSSEQARGAVERFFEGFNAQDDSIIRESLQFPHVRIASGQVRVIAEPASFRTPFAALQEREGWDHSTLDRAEVIHAGPDKVHFDVAFTRYHADGSAYATHRAVWVVTRVDGRWGIQARSSFAP